MNNPPQFSGYDMNYQEPDKIIPAANIGYNKDWKGGHGSTFLPPTSTGGPAPYRSSLWNHPEYTQKGLPGYLREDEWGINYFKRPK